MLNFKYVRTTNVYESTNGEINVRMFVDVRSSHINKFAHHMIIQIKVTTKASQNEVIQRKSRLFHIRTTAVPEKGKANKAVINLLSEFLNIPKSRITIKSGLGKINKIIEIED